MLRKKRNARPAARGSRDLVIGSRVMRYSRDLAIQLKKADAALKKAAAVAVKLRGPAGARTTRGSRDLAIELKKAGAAIKKARKLATKTRFSRDLAIAKTTRGSRDL